MIQPDRDGMVPCICGHMRHFAKPCAACAGPNPAALPRVPPRTVEHDNPLHRYSGAERVLRDQIEEIVFAELIAEHVGEFKRGSVRVANDIMALLARQAPVVLPPPGVAVGASDAVQRRMVEADGARTAAGGPRKPRTPQGYREWGGS